ncbi:MAG: Uma2 family endonuclease, partial [Candidatus Eremiobacterota bacterium]
MLTHPQAVDYPDSDGNPMTDSDVNRQLMEYVEFALDGLFRDEPNTYVSADLFIYFRKGARGARIAPDVFLVKGVEKRRRDRFLLWEEGVGPCVVFEFLSPSTRQRDLSYKPARYASLGVKELYLFDSGGTWVEGKLMCYQRRGRRLMRVRDRFSPELGVELRVEGDWLRLVKDGKPLPTADEERQRADAEARRADKEAR